MIAPHQHSFAVQRSAVPDDLLMTWHIVSVMWRSQVMPQQYIAVPPSLIELAPAHVLHPLGC
jgi:hypothetical protein